MVIATCAVEAGRAGATPTSDGLIVYGNSTTTPQFETYVVSTNNFPNAAGAVGAAAGASPTFVVDRAASTRDEHIAGYITTGGVLYVMRWNGSSWTNEWNVTVGGTGVNGRRFDIAYEYANDRAVVVYSNNTSGTNEVRYRIYDPVTGWSTAQNIDPARITGTPDAIKLAVRRAAGSNAIAMAVADTNAALTAMVWNGSTWGSEPGSAALTTALQQTATPGDKDAFDLAYENQSGDLMVVYSTTTPANQYATLVSTTWTTNQTLSATGRTIQSMFAVGDTDVGSNRILIGWDRTASANRYAVVWDGTTLGTVSTIGLNANATAPPANSHQMTGAWLTSGSSKRAVVVYQSTTATNIDYAYFDVTAGTWTTSQAATGYASAEKRWVSMDVDLASPDTLMLTYSDANSDLWAKRLVFNGSTLTWSNADSGAALTATLTNTTTQDFSFAYDRYASPAGTLTLDNNSGSEAPTPGGAICAATGGATYIDYFTMIASAATYVNAITTTFSADPSGILSLLEVTDDAGTQQGSLPNPSGLNPTVSGMSFAAPTATAAQYRLRITPNAAATSSGTFMARVTGVTNSASLPLGGGTSDSSSASITIDGTASPEVTGASASGGTGTVTASWTNPGAGTVPGTDFGSYVVVLGNTQSIDALGDRPTKGISVYTLNTTIGSNGTIVVCAGNITNCTKDALGSSVTYYLKIFTRDGCANWSAGVQTSATTQTSAVTTIGNGVNPTVSSTPVAPGSAAVAIDSFTVQKSTTPTTPDNITAVRLTFDPGTAQGIALVEIMNDGLTGQPYGSFTNPADVQSITLTTPIASTTTQTQYKIRVTPRSHAAMPAPPGGAYAVRAVISDITVTYAKNLSPGDSSSSTVNVDNASSPDVSAASATSGAGSVTASWTNPAAGTAPGTDFASYVVVLGNTVPVTGTPAEGTGTYTEGGTIGADSIACVVSPATPSGAGSCSKSGLSGGQAYYMKIFARDAMNNWSPGVAVSSSAANVATTVTGISAAVVNCQNVSVAATYTGDSPTSNNVVTFARGATSNGPFTNVTGCTNLQDGTNPRACTDSTVGTSGGTYYYRATFTDNEGVTGSPVTSGAVVVPACGANPGSSQPNTLLPVVSIQNPGNMTRVTGAYRLQVLVHSPSAIDDSTSDVTSVNVSTNGADPTCTSGQMNGFTVTAGYTGKVGHRAWIYERSMVSASGTLYLKVCVLNPTGSVLSEIVQVVAQTVGTGDGNLLARDNSSQLCVDCHAVASHSSQSTTSQYGSWALACRDCHQPHKAKNAELVRSQITPPSYRGVQSPKTVVFYDETTGDSGATQGGFVNNSLTGPCQVCHTQTKNSSGTARWRADGNLDTAHYSATAPGGTSPCTSCHSHKDGFKASCTACHGTASRTSIAGADPLQPAAPPVTAPTATVFVTGGGAHVKHVNGDGTQPTLRANPIQCSSCHPTPLGTTHGGTTDVQWTGLASSGSVTPLPTAGALQTSWPSNPSCTNWCHGQALTGGSHKTPLWSETGAQATFCGSCHQSDGTGHYGTNCAQCHGTGYATTGITGTARDTHIDGSIEAPYAACPDCHSKAQTIKNGPLAGGSRREIISEFTTANWWSHKRNGAYTVTKYDCTVCHMEGNPADGSTNDYDAVTNPTGTHKDGYVNLRDPDSGNEIQGVTWTNASGASAGYFTATGTTLQTGIPLHNGFDRFSRNLALPLESDPAAPVVEAIEINHCLKCHDSNGAMSTNARVPASVMPNASAGKPFGTTIASTQGTYTGGSGYTACSPAGGNNDGCVTNIAASFSTANASYHPIMGKQNNSYVNNRQMTAPWNALSPDKTLGTTTSWGYLISCWDCHALPADDGTTITRTVTAHGGSTTIRAPIWQSNSTRNGNLCRVCHFPSSYTTGPHGAYSAAATLAGNNPYQYMGSRCYFCHLSATSKPARPVPAQDLHGFDAFTVSMGTDRMWPIGAAESYKPYAFMRNVGPTGNWRSSSWRPTVAPGLTSGTATCAGNQCNGQNGTYAPGGVY